MTDSGTPKEDRKRFFKDELESSESQIPSLAERLDKSKSFLFGETTEPEDSGSSLFVPNQMDIVEFEKGFKEIMPDISDKMCKTLFEKFEGDAKPVASAVDYYFDHNKSLIKESKKDTEIIDLSDDSYDDQHSSSIIHSNHMNSDPPIHSDSHPKLTFQSLFSQKKDELKKRKAETTNERIAKRKKSSILWKKFLGSMQVTAMATRPTIRPLKYGSELKLHVTESKNLSPSKIYDSKGKRKLSMAQLVKLRDREQDREIGRIPEDIAQIVYPLIDESGVSFEVTLVYSGDKRLSIGDSFIIQLDCFLTSQLFEKEPVSSQSDSTSLKQSGWEISTNAISETQEEVANKYKRVGLLALFNKLRIKEVTDEAKVLESIDNSEPDIVDLEDDDTFESIVSENNNEQDINHSDTMDLNQLQNFYSIAQSLETLKNLPETTPSKDIMKLNLRRYQKQGLTWMLRREGEFSKAASSEEITPPDAMMNPLWKQFIWPNDMSWVSKRDSSVPKSSIENIFYYANLHTGEFSMEKPILVTSMKGGILSDEMGLGKTISTLSLILSAPRDSSSEGKNLFEKEPSEMSPSLTKNPQKPYASKTTLIVVPMSLLHQWHSEFEKSCSDKNLHAEIYYGGNVSNLKAHLTKSKNPPTVLITTYGIIQNEWTKLVKTSEPEIDLNSTTGLFSVSFYRIVLDEGHIIRNRQTITSKAVLQLTGKCKWVLTGTPIINRLDDMYSLVKFLNLEPWSQIGFWKQFVSIPFENKHFKEAFDVVNSILEPVFLRRTKSMKDVDGKPLVDLPPKEVVVERLQFNEDQDTVYKQLLNRAEDSVKLGLARGDLLKKYSTILVNILRLRQVCCDVRLLGSKDENDEDLSNNNIMLNGQLDINSLLTGNDNGTKTNDFTEEELAKTIKIIGEKYYPIEDSSSFECSICTTEPIALSAIIFTECEHAFCKGCLIEYCDYQHMKNLDMKCPLCRHEISKDRLLALKKKEDGSYELCHFNTKSRSSKIVALANHLQQLQDSSPSEQVVVFSQFSSYLDILDNELGEIFSSKSTKIYKFDGRLSLKDRSSVLKDFQIKIPGVQKILLLSLKAGGVGLNLTSASYAFMMDPWWSPSMEDQAIDRIHRIGQKKNVKVTRFIMENSIEEKMLQIQERKRTIGEAMDADEDDRRKRRIDEIKMLFE
ncbi:similar to Saccharomyces cerevisiae YLR032W RAD5 DNA helicase proposed to promote replication fork regression during postreplication repair by template switching [Maudiozyma barnettii]|uniref:DNA repair protein RAD5 n=1 Tax=Maudiozyma barnettii TaxID=61262 RepID=A0A8H2ZIN0_9SACH|nr:DNA helicase RAD5 [Kazachstania barnettii]CAB4257109.1 similar to Saccharomyces cerevisiae YLR032W RAD5 DNA helicase proposed to promote replication fork regression during postreplication repair by template switching [Kazachstania barnettii]CAD1779479.1 similar to Saccharomyces cerevisiae YLR032W RAD5 DNA helicase proposed to promote replication fork regression during postreplication repair by template switching [Kazachstania barnettii]